MFTLRTIGISKKQWSIVELRTDWSVVIGQWFAVLLLLFIYPPSWLAVSFGYTGSAKTDFTNHLHKFMWKTWEILSCWVTWKILEKISSNHYKLSPWLWNCTIISITGRTCAHVWLCRQLSGVILMLCAAGDCQQMTNLVSELIKQFANSTCWSHRQL